MFSKIKHARVAVCITNIILQSLEVPNRQIRATIDGDFAENPKNFLRAARIRGISRSRTVEESSATVPRRAEGSENRSDFSSP